MAVKNNQWQRSLGMMAHVVLIVVVLAAMYLLKEILIPVAMALFLSFLLYPFFKWLQHYGMPRKLAVTTVVLFTLIVLGSGFWIVSAQLTNLAGELPNYTRNITRKLQTLNEMIAGSGSWKHLTEEVSRVVGGKGESQIPPTQDTLVGPLNQPVPSKEPTVVIVKQELPRWLVWVSGNAGSALLFLGELVLALVLVVFILLNREDLLNRILRLAGPRRVSLTGKAVGETGARISRFLFVQFIVNSMFGLLVACSLLILGLNYALLWGFLSGVLRYMPYVGPWVSAVFPLTLSLAQFDGWWQPLVILCIYLTLETIISNIVEPVLYGQSIGVSEVALLVAAAFWGWMWGIVGLVLSAPLTVVLVVMGKYVSELRYLTILFSDQPALTRDRSVYQRLLAGDQDEAERQVRDRLSEPEPEKLYDEMLIPAVSHLKVDYQYGMIDQEEVKEVLTLVNDLLDAIPEKENEKPVNEFDHPKAPGERISLLSYPVRDASDHLAMTMLGKLLDKAKWNYELAPVDSLSSEIVAKLKEHRYEALCIGTLQPGGTLHLRHLCKKIRLEHPELRILVGMWGIDKISEEQIRSLTSEGAEWVGHTLEGASESLAAWYPVWREQMHRQVA